MRRTSVSLPTTHVHVPDLYEKPSRYNSRKPPLIAHVKLGWMSQSQKARWLKTSAVVLVIVVLCYVLSPRGVGWYHDRAQKPSQSTTVNGQTPSDSSYGTDRCLQSYSKDKPIVQYVLMIDAGSTGSRIHVYKFNNCGPTPELEHEEFKMTDEAAGGLSAYKADPQAAAASLDVLMDVAMVTVPDALKSCSPVAVKATAGLRRISEGPANEILDAVRTHLETDYPFPVVSAENDGVVVMDGKFEGVYAWITINYLLGKIGGPDHDPTSAVFDLGGGSTQIVFQPSFPSLPLGGMPQKLADGDHKYDLSFGGADFELYQHSHLGYGLVSATKAIHRLLIDDIVKNSKSMAPDWSKKPVTNPCITPGVSIAVEVDLGSPDSPDSNPAVFNMTGPSYPAPAQCRNLAERILKKDADCKLSPCSFNGVHQPSLAKTFSRGDVYVFSYFYDRTKPLGMPDSFTIRELHDLATTVCAGPSAWDVFETVPGALRTLTDNPNLCLELNFMVALLHVGYDMPIDREVRVAKKIKGNELGWCLGASLPLLGKKSGWSCKVKQVA